MSLSEELRKKAGFKKMQHDFSAAVISTMKDAETKLKEGGKELKCIEVNWFCLCALEIFCQDFFDHHIRTVPQDKIRGWLCGLPVFLNPNISDFKWHSKDLQ